MSEPKLNELQLQMKHTAEALERMEKSNEASHCKIEQLIRDIRKEMKEEYASYKEFLPLQKLIHGLVGAILTSVILAALGLVIL